MEELKRLQEVRLSLADRLKGLAARQSEWTAADRREWKRLNEAYDSNMELLNAEQARIEAQISARHGITARLGEIDGWSDGLPANLGRGGDGTEGERGRQMLQRSGPLSEVDRAVTGWFKAAIGMPVSGTEQSALASAGFGLGATEIRLRLSAHEPAHGDKLRQLRGVTNAQTAGSGIAGGFTVPEGFLRSLEVALQEYGGIMRVATVLRTSTGESLTLPQADDTDNMGAILPETQATTEQDVEFSALKLTSYEYTSKVVRVQNQLLRDSGIDVGSELGRMLGTRVGRIVNEHLTNGSGASQPQGLIPAATLGVTTASSTAVSADEIIQLIHSVDNSYRNGRAGFMMHDAVFREVSLLKDGNGDYLLRPGLQDGTTPTLRGWPVTLNNQMSGTLASGNKVMAFGDFSRYVVRQVGQLRLLRLVERWADYNQTGFLLFSAWDGGLRDAGTHPVKVLQMA